MRLEVCTIYQGNGRHIAIVERGRKWAWYTTLRGIRKKVSLAILADLNPQPVDDLVERSAMKVFKQRGFI